MEQIGQFDRVKYPRRRPWLLALVVLVIVAVAFARYWRGKPAADSTEDSGPPPSPAAAQVAAAGGAAGRRSLDSRRAACAKSHAIGHSHGQEDADHDQPCSCQRQPRISVGGQPKPHTGWCASGLNFARQGTRHKSQEIHGKREKFGAERSL